MQIQASLIDLYFTIILTFYLFQSFALTFGFFKL